MSRDYCFTAWGEPKPDYDKLRYICWGLEKCPTTDREHYQGFAVFNRTYRVKGAKSVLGDRTDTHLEPRRGTRQQAREYCRKDGRFFEWGELNLHTSKELFKKDINFIKENHPEFYCRYYRGLTLLKSDKGEIWRDINVKWLWGKPGVGKTRYVMEKNNTYKLDYPYKWWDGYNDENILLLDDMKNINDIDRNYLLNLLDGYRMRLETKGGHTWAKWNEVYITSNNKPEIYDDAILRRIDEFVNVTSDEAAG